MGDDLNNAPTSENKKTIKLNIKCQTGQTFSVETDPESTVEEFKRLVAERTQIPAEQQRLIFGGHVLKDPRTLASYEIKDTYTVHLVRGAPSSSAAPSSTATASPSSSSVPPPMGGLGGLFGPVPGGQQGMEQMYQNMMRNPQAMNAMLNNPMMQQILDNPDFMRNMLQSNPQIQRLLEQNPHVAQVLNDPQLMRQTLEIMRNPNLMREMIRNQDRQLSNIESLPEGFNALQSMYTNIQEPLLSAATQATQSSNPFASFFTPQNSSQFASATTSTPPSATPNSSPLPNPWGGGATAPAPSSSSSSPSSTSSAPSSSTGSTGSTPSFFPFGMPPTGQPTGTQQQQQQQQGFDPFGMGMFGMPGMSGMDPGMMLGYLQNPVVQQMMQQFFSNPAMLQQLVQSNPMLQQLVQSNPQLMAAMQNPEFLRQMMNPQNLQAMLQMQTAMQQLQRSFGSLAMNPPTTGATDTTGTAGIGTASPSSATPSTTASPTATAPVDPAVRFATQLQQLNEMGFTDQQANLRALIATMGNVNLAVERLLSGL